MHKSYHFKQNISKKFYFVVVDQGHIANINNITIENSKIQKTKKNEVVKVFFFYRKSSSNQTFININHRTGGFVREKKI